MSLLEEQTKVQHLSWRAGFGAGPAVINDWDPKKGDLFFHKLMKGGEKLPGMIKVSESRAVSQMNRTKSWKQMSQEERKAIRKISRAGMKHLNLAWIEKMATTDHPFREKMALFWHGHFACRVNNVIHNQQMLDVIRRNALGNFRDLLFAVSKSPAMLQFLNNQQNKKQHPNENFAREVMELFTMGHGHYTEEDVKEGARAFTGWGYNKEGEFVFRKRLHDEGIKTFLGKTGNFKGDDVLNILLQHKATAHHITEKVYRFFVNSTSDKAVVNRLADQFYQSNYDIASLMETIFRSDWFYDPKNRDNRIKSPVELLVGMRRTIPVTFGKEKVEILFQRVMDQTLFYPPNVAGWPGGRSWIDSSTLLFRMQLPQIIYYSEKVTTRPKDMPDELTNSYSGKNISDHYVRNFARRVDASVHWNSYLDSFKKVTEDRLPANIAAVLLTNRRKIDDMLLKKYADHTSREHLIKSLSIDLMSTPEYQLC